MPNQHKNLNFSTRFCDDVRLEAGNKLSFMGVFQNIMVQQLPLSLIKFAVVNHWQGSGSYLSEVRILTPDRQQPSSSRNRHGSRLRQAVSPTISASLLT